MEKKIRENLDRGIPVLYGAFGITTSSEHIHSHAFVCDGYSSDGKFHFNWGWRSSHDGYYALDAMEPRPDVNYNLTASAIFELEPPAGYTPYCEFDCSLDSFCINFFSMSHNSPYDVYEIIPNTCRTLLSGEETSLEFYRTIFAGAMAEYVAHEEIILRPGFTAENGSEFYAHIDPCGNCGENLKVRTPMNNEVYSIRFSDFQDSVFSYKPSDIKLYPNPAGDYVMIESSRVLVGNIMLTNEFGKRERRWRCSRLTDFLIELNVSTLSKGTYYLRMVDADGDIHVGKFVKY